MHNPEGMISVLNREKDKRYFAIFMEFGTMICGLLCLVAGVMGIYWATKGETKGLPLMTLNNCVGGFFMIVFGSCMAILGFGGISTAVSSSEEEDVVVVSSTGKEQGSFITEQALFLDIFAGRGVFLIYLSIRVMTLGKYYCLLAGLGLMFFGIGNIIVHGFVTVGPKTCCKQLNYVSAAVGVAIVIAGGMGFYWGTKVIAPWPPLTWNTCFGGVFVCCFGLVVLYLSVKTNEVAQAYTELRCRPEDDAVNVIKIYFRFLDTFFGRGCFFIFVGLRILPLGKFYCLVTGMVTFSFGVLNVALRFLYPEVESISNEAALAG